jgi:hypothetical protein
VQNQRLPPKLHQPAYRKAPVCVYDVAEESKSNASDPSMDTLHQAGATLYRNGGFGTKRQQFHITAVQASGNAPSDQVNSLRLLQNTSPESPQTSPMGRVTPSDFKLSTVCYAVSK